MTSFHRDRELSSPGRSIRTEKPTTASRLPGATHAIACPNGSIIRIKCSVDDAHPCGAAGISNAGPVMLLPRFDSKQDEDRAILHVYRILPYPDPAVCERFACQQIEFPTMPWT